jgi:hypothetical protein
VPLQNRVTPLGELVADPGRGLVYGNRGCLHDEDGNIRRRYALKRWISCRLRFRGRHREPLMQPGRYTELFFLDEATALAAGHRPCAECRRPDYDALRAAWSYLHPGDPPGADAIDSRLHAERLDPATGGRRHHEASLAELPDGAFILREGEPWLVLGTQLLRWSAAGYSERAARPASGQVEVVTAPSLVELLRRAWDPLVPLLHPSVAIPPAAAAGSARLSPCGSALPRSAARGRSDGRRSPS